jgi:AAA domain
VVVELVGPAGAGKTTLAKNVQRADRSVHAGLTLWGLPRWRLLRGAIALVPTVVASAVRRRRLRWAEVAQMIRLDALRRLVARLKSRHRIILLDEGPVFGISQLDLAFAQRGSVAPAKWRRRALSRWAQLLDSIILLDAGDEALATRIRTRRKSHRVKHATDATIRGFANGYRKAFDRIVAEMGRTTRGKRVAVERLRTDGPLNRNAARLKATLAQHHNGH